MGWIKQQFSHLIGRKAEDFALRYLQQQGLDLLERNYRCRNGEIDLIMQDGEELVFVEVKYRKNTSHGQALEYFHAHKKRKFEHTLLHYMQQKKLNPSMIPHRIDLLAIDQDQVQWLKHL